MESDYFVGTRRPKSVVCWFLLNTAAPRFPTLTPFYFRPFWAVRPHTPRVSDGTRTRDILDHNQVLYQLSYTHHASGRIPSCDHPAQREVYRAVTFGR